MAEPLVVVGAGGFGRETLDVIDAVNAAGNERRWDLLGVVDDGPSDRNLDRLRARGTPFLGPLDSTPANAWVVIAVGSPEARAGLAARLDGNCRGYATLVHPTAVVGSSGRVSEGTVVCAQSSIGTNVTLGRHVHINAHSVIGHDTRLDDFVSMNPNGTISGECFIGREALVGAGAIVLQGLGLGSRSVVGAGAVVTRNVSDRRLVKGIPAR